MPQSQKTLEFLQKLKIVVIGMMTMITLRLIILIPLQGS